MSLNSPPGKTVVAVNSGAGLVTKADDMVDCDMFVKLGDYGQVSCWQG